MTVPSPKEIIIAGSHIKKTTFVLPSMTTQQSCQRRQLVPHNHRVRRSKRKGQKSSALYGLFHRVYILQCEAPKLTQCQWALHNNQIASAIQLRRHLLLPLRYSTLFAQPMPCKVSLCSTVLLNCASPLDFIEPSRFD